jgi:prolyl-tRNA synthetase
VKFADADLLGYPLQVVIGKRGIQGGTVDLKVRATGERTQASLEDATRSVLDLLAAAP